MKNTLLIVGLVSCLAGTQAIAQKSFVGSDPEPRNAVIEEFSGIYCGYCPDGAARITSLKSANPGRVVAIKFHSSNLYSNPSSASHPDFREDFAYAIDDMADVSGFPTGAVNRNSSPMAKSRSLWKPEAEDIINNGGMSPVNIGLKTEWNASKRELKVTVQTYYTDNSQAGTPYNLLNVGLIQSGVVGFQVEYPASGPTIQHEDYEHNETFRAFFTGDPGVWDDSTDSKKIFKIEDATIGDEIKNTAMGNLSEFTYTYIVPAKYKNTDAIIDDMEVVAYVNQGDKKNIFTGVVVPAKGSTGHSGNFEAAPAPGKEAVGIDENTAFTGVSVYPNPAKNIAYINVSTNNTTNINVDVYNLIGEKVANPFNGTINAGSNKRIEFNTESLKSGIYFVNIKSGNAVETLKLNVAH